MRLLVIRTSAMGDVALVAPVLAGIRSQHPDIEIVLLTRPVFKPFFNSINGIMFFFPDLKSRHKGLAGIYRLFGDLKNQFEFDAIIDLHDVLRSKILRFLFLLYVVQVSVIDKWRK
jgi:ADP-heptose:LPS heptosyltransferase